MIAAFDLVGVEASLDEPRALVSAEVGKGLDLVSGDTDHEHGLPDDVVGDPVPYIGDVVGTAGELPDPPPEVFGFPLVPLLKMMTAASAWSQSNVGGTCLSV